MSLREKIVAAMAAIAVGPDVEVGQCQRGVGRTGQRLLADAGFARESASYWNDYGFASANAAWAAAKAAGRVRSGTPQPLDIVHFEYGVYGHVGVVTGADSFVSLTANRAGFIRDLGNGVFESTISGYSKSRPLLGVATSNGNRPPLSTWIKDVLAPDERTVKSNANAFRRVSPDTGAALTPKDNRIKAGSTHRITRAYLTGKPISQNGTTDCDVWFEVEAYGWAWAGGFTSQSTANIPVTDARPKPPPVVVVPEPEPDPVEPEPEPAADPEPEIPAEPITKEDAVTVSNIINPPDLDAGALGAVVENPKTRKRLYAWYVIVALVVGALITGTVAGVGAFATLASTNLPPALYVWVIVLAVAVGVIGYIGPYAAVLASANTPKR